MPELQNSPMSCSRLLRSPRLLAEAPTTLMQRWRRHISGCIICCNHIEEACRRRANPRSAGPDGETRPGFGGGRLIEAKIRYSIVLSPKSRAGEKDDDVFLREARRQTSQDGTPRTG
ncbi:predicted protein [Chaetomium globosum CBS 148.51]|uniref:Uncharacterized protein n=1 Tax=Chaetomium globosum (strain ATCC 6205 / CBS 148.51 / DSM 1962 / NBRC 6347 / NRRL 1970) TaxID=306901 RepID=Q2GZB1_CHAGB|nr:uncharacterized protein CHGG_05135 [Chaetomium globosum CBS 148.51]EAQ88516.1 predicted protein [Chaetomium globosum CBS 148.51]